MSIPRNTCADVFDSSSCVDSEKGCITIDKQLSIADKSREYTLQPLINSKVCVIWPAPFGSGILKRERRKQLAAQLKAGELWDAGCIPDLTFTNEIGCHFSHKTVFKRFRAAVAYRVLPIFVLTICGILTQLPRFGLVMMRKRFSSRWFTPQPASRSTKTLSQRRV